MNIPWAEQVLQEWIAYAEGCVANRNHLSDNPATDQLMEMEYRAAAVVGRILGQTEPPNLMIRFSTMDGYNLLPGIRVARYALGRLRTEDETAKNLAPDAPSMSADDLHPLIWEAASSLWNDDHFGVAVQRAATQLNARVQDLTGRYDVADRELMTQVFSAGEPSAEKPRLRWPGPDDDLTVRSMRTGILAFSQGVFVAIRNPATHRPEDVGRQVALEYLATLSTLARWIDNCELLTA